MASIKRYLSSKVEGNGRSEIQFRLSLTKDIKLRLKSGIYIKPSRFNAGTIVKPRANQEEIAELKELERKIRDLEDYIYALCEDNPVERLTKEFLTKEIDRFHHPKRERKPKEVEEKLQKKFIELVEEFPLENVSDTLKGDTDLGFMLYHMKFEDGGHPKDNDWDKRNFSDKADALFYRPHMIDGVIDVAKYREMMKC